MKFKFCSDGDCPLWALAGLHALSSLPAPMFRDLVQYVADERSPEVRYLCPMCLPVGSPYHIVEKNKQGEIWVSCLQFCILLLGKWREFMTPDYRMFPRGLQNTQDDKIADVLKYTSLSSREECARAAAVIRWVLRQSWSGSCPGAQVTRDLLVLGVPRAHANALAEAVDEHREEYEAQVKANGFMVNKITDVAITPGPEGTVDTYKMTLHVDDVFTGEQNRRELLIEKNQAKLLLQELKMAYKKMVELDASNTN